MGLSESKSDDGGNLSGGGAAARAANFTAPPPTTDRAVGLDNYGNTCYCNATIQGMYHCRPLRDRLAELYLVLKGQRTGPQQLAMDIDRNIVRCGGYSDDSSDEDEDTDTQVGSPREPSVPAVPGDFTPADPKTQQDSILFRLCELFDLMETSASAGKKHVGPRHFVNKVKAENVMFRNTQQQDAHEFVMFVLNTIIDEERTLLGVKGPKAISPLQHILCGVTLTNTYCGECDTETSLAQQFIDVNMDIVPNSSLRHCSDLYSAYETLSGEDKFRCNACTSPVDARRRALFRRLPAVLVVQLKRFSYNERAAAFTKKNDRVAFAEVMTLVTTTGKEMRYELCGVVVHHGATANLGHYVALVQAVGSHRWFKCDDDTATTFAPRDLQRYYGTSDAFHDSSLANTATAYLLFYCRCSSN